jgi:hypothetical protein
MKDVRDGNEVDLDLVVKAGQKENTGVDYKASAALNFRGLEAPDESKGNSRRQAPRGPDPRRGGDGERGGWTDYLRYRPAQGRLPGPSR